MSPLNRGPLLGPRMPPAGMRPPPPRFGRLPMLSMPPRMPPPPMPPMGAMYGPMRPRMPPPPPRPGGMMRPGGPPPPPRFRARGPLPPLMMGPMGPMGPRMGPRGPPMRPGMRPMMAPPGMPHMRPRFPPGNGNMNMKSTMKANMKAINEAKRVAKLEELELKKPWMTDEIRAEIQKKNKLYAKAKKNKDAKEWEEFKDLRNKVTRMIRDAKNDYMAKHPKQAALYQDEPEYYDGRDENCVSDEDESFYCEICDRDFHTEVLLNDHKNSHRVCGIDGCTFSAHPKLVDKHITMQHCTGLYQRMKNIKTPEDIEKWIAERKKKYPTKNNIDLKNAEILEKKERGEIIEQSRGRPPSPRSKKPERKRRGKKRKFVDVKPEAKEEEMEYCNGIPPFRGTNSMAELSEETSKLEIEESVSAIQFSDEEDTSMPSAPMATLPVHSLLSLVADYGSDSDDPPDEVPIKKLHLEEPNLPQPPAPPLKEAPPTPKQPAKNEFQRRPHDEPPRLTRKIVNQRKRNLLLERLLSRSIQHERNYICQCIKHIVDNNFFD